MNPPQKYKKTIKFVTIKEEKNYLYPQKLAGILLFTHLNLKRISICNKQVLNKTRKTMDEQVFFTPDEHKQLIALYKDYCNYQETLCKKTTAAI